MSTRRCVLFALMAPLATGSALARHSHHHAAPAGFDLHREDIVRFVDDVAQRDSLDRAQVLALIKKAHREPKILEAMSAPAEAVVPWWEYRERFVTAERIGKGVQFWRAHRADLERISTERGVEPQYLVAILGMETLYGHRTGKFRVLDALATLAFDFPPRADYFRDELEQFLLLTHENRISPLKATGSYAGAMGAPQFMPSAYRAYAVDEDGDHAIDLWDDWEDVLGSVANFFKQHGWEAGAPVLAETQIEAGSNPQATGKVDLNDTVAGLADKGVKLTTDVPLETPAVLVAAERKDGPAFRVGFKNFYVITRYNRSVRYAMAVYDLAQAIMQTMAQEAPTGQPQP